MSTSFPEKIVKHILWLKSVDVKYARYAFKYYDELLPWLNLGEEIKKAMGDK